jgi:hypothetical protein
MLSSIGRLCVVATFAMVVAACGDSDGDGQGSETEAWADNVCSAAGEWTDAVDEARATLSDTSGLSADDIEGAIGEVADATESFVADLRNVGSPDIEAGDEAQRQLSMLSDELQSQADVIEQAISEGSASLDELLASVSSVTGALSAMIGDAQATIDDLRKLDGAEELESAFASSPSCQDLQ